MHVRPTFNQYFDYFNYEDYWKLFIDFNQWQYNDPYIFDKDESKGYFQSTSLALLQMLLTVEQPLTLDLIIALHDVAYHEKFASASKGLWGDAHSGLEANSFSSNGLIELQKKLKASNLAFFIGLRIKNNNDQSLLIPLKEAAEKKNFAKGLLKLLTSDESTYDKVFKGYKYNGTVLAKEADIEKVIKICEAYIEEYKKAITSAKNDNEKLFFIARFIQDMHQYHPFGDGNGRTFIFLLLNKLLLMNNLAPTAVPDPYRFTGYSVKELVDEIKEGQENVKNYLCTRTSPNVISLPDYIAQRINLSPLAHRQLFLSSTQLASAANKLVQLLKSQDAIEIVKLLNEIPEIQQINFLENEITKKAYNENDKLYLQKIKQGLTILRYYGLGKYEPLLHAIITGGKPDDLFEYLAQLDQARLPRAQQWLEIITNLLQSPSETKINLFSNLIEEAIDLREAGLFDVNQYFKNLENTHPYIFKELNISNSISLSASSKYTPDSNPLRSSSRSVSDLNLVTKAVEAIEDYIANAKSSLGFFAKLFNPEAGINRAKAYLKVLYKLAPEQILQKKITLYAILMNGRGQNLHHTICKALGCTDQEIQTQKIDELAEHLLGNEIRKELITKNLNFTVIQKKLINPLNDYAINHKSQEFQAILTTLRSLDLAKPSFSPKSYK